MTSRSKPRAIPAVGGIRGRAAEQGLVDGIDGLAARSAELRLVFEAAALLDRIGQLAEGVGQLEAPRVELEALDQPRIPRLRTGERRRAGPASRTRTSGRPAARRGSMRSRNT